MVNNKLTFVVLSLISISISAQNNKWTFGNSNTQNFKGFGLGYEYYTGHEELSKNFKFKRSPIEEYNIGHGMYITFFNFNPNKKINYYIDGGFIFWNDKNMVSNTKIDQRSEVIHITTKYTLGRFGILARLGGIYNHQTITYENNLRIEQKNNLDLSFGFGLSIPIFIEGLRFSTFITKIDNYYHLSGTIILPILFRQ